MNMKQTLIILGLLVVGFSGMSQEQSRERWDNRTLQLAAVSPVDEFKAVVKKEVTCSETIDHSGMYSMFSPNAIIEVSSVRTKLIKRYTPGAYFRILHSLACGPHPLYPGGIKIGFGHTHAGDGIVSSVNGGYTVVYYIDQSFSAITATGAQYHDLTIKRITVLCTPDSKGGLEVKIIGITVESTSQN